MTDIHRATFIEEAHELLSELENALLELEETPEDMDLVGKVFRAMHTIKGSGAMFGFDDIAEFTHQIETVYDKVRNGEIPVTKEMISLTLSAGDIIKSMLDDSEGSGQSQASSKEIVTAFKNMASIEVESRPVLHEPASDPKSASPVQLEGTEAQAFRIRFKPSPEIFASGSNPVLLLDELRGLGECEIAAQRDEIPDLENMNPENCYVYWDIILSTDKGLNAIKDVFIFVEDQCETLDRPGRGRVGRRYQKAGRDTRRTGRHH